MNIEPIRVDKKIRKNRPVRRSEAALRPDSLPVAYQTLDTQARFISINAAWAEMFGYTHADVVGKPLHAFISPGQENIVREMLRGCGSQKTARATLEITHKSGTRLICELACSAEHDTRGRLKKYYCILTDATRQAHERRTLAAAENTLDSIYSQAPVGIFRSSLDGKLLFANRVIARILKFDSREELLCHVNKTSLSDALYVDKLKRRDMIQKARINSGQWAQTQMRFWCKDGSTVTANLYYRQTKTGEPCLEGFVEDISAIKLLSDALTKSEETFRSLTQCSPLGVYFTDTDWNCTFVNDKWCAMAGMSPEQARGKGWTERIHEPERPAVNDNWRKSLASGGTWGFEYRLLNDTGALTWAWGAVAPIRDPNGRITAHMGISLDITGRKHADEGIKASRQAELANQKQHEQELLDQADFFKTLLNAIPLPVFYKNTQGIYWGCNSAFTDLLGKSKEDILGKNTYELNQPETARKFAEMDKELLAQRGRQTCELAYDTADRNIVVNKATFADANGRVTGIIGAVFDITNLRRIETALRESEENFRHLFDNMADGVIICDVADNGQNFIIAKINAAAERIARVQAGDVLNKRVDGILPGIGKTALLDTLRRVYHTGATEHLPIALYSDNRLSLWMKNSVCRLPTGKVAVIFTDHTEHKVAEDALHMSEERFRGIAERSTNIIMLIDISGNSTYISPAVKILGYEPEELLGKPITALCAPGNSALRLTEIPREIVLLHKNGTPHQLEARGMPIFERGDSAGMQIILTDITEHKKLEETLRNSIRDKELLLKELNHRVKNNLQIISSLFNLQSRNIKDKETLNVLRDGASRIKSIALIHEKLFRSNNVEVINFYDYASGLIIDLFHSYKTFMSQAPVILPEIKIGKDIYFDIDLAIPCGLIINELISNSMKHAFRRTLQGKISIKLENDGQDVYTLEVRDNGSGFPRKFDIEKPTSLGLQLVASLTSQINGRIRLLREKGTCFMITFPADKHVKRVRTAE
jgi:PAS domain S-box-containing protein